MNHAHRRYREELARENHRDKMNGIYEHGIRDRRSRERGAPLATNLEDHTVCTSLAHNPILFYGVDVYELHKGPEKWLKLPLFFRWMHLTLIPGTEVERAPLIDGLHVKFSRDGKSILTVIDYSVCDAGDTAMIDAIYNNVCDAGEVVRDLWFREYVG
jgi:hypothetical protein